MFNNTKSHIKWSSQQCIETKFLISYFYNSGYQKI